MVMLFLPVIVSFSITSAFIPIAKRIGIKYGICDNPGGDPLKIHPRPIPNLGGVVMFVAILISAMTSVIFVKFDLWKLLGILSCGAIVLSLGLWDDLRWKSKTIYKPIVKFTAQVLVSVVVSVLLSIMGIRIQFIPISVVMGLLAAFYVFGGMNAINMQDGIDGLAGGLVAISAIGFTTLSIYTGNTLGLVLSLSTLGAVLGFLIYNFHPASIFMGDNGSHLLGFMLALLAISSTAKPYDLRWFIGPILIIGLPVFDAAWAVIRRLARRKPLFEGDRGHFYDRMMRRGLTVRQTVFVCYLLQAVFVSSGVAIVI
ncbi:MAG: hypothetical protein DRG83_13525 [Deltaproteobacteria bacterium]|nr:MAG: hypothetical protein DRG83_13525 [Deltaproteobacteria bacterium]